MKIALTGPAYSMYRYVNRVGIELEGGWNDPVDFVLEHDGSVMVDATYNGEMPSPPLPPRDISKWMKEHYPDAVNASCGMHVHVSVKHQSHYSRLMEKEFRDFMKSSLKVWGEKLSIRSDHPFWSRLRGENSFCKDEFYPELQVQHREKGPERYTMLNYTWARYGTVECRVLPGFSAAVIGISAVYAVVDTFEAYLRAKCRSAAPSLEGIVQVSELPPEEPDEPPMQLTVLTVPPVAAEIRR